MAPTVTRLILSFALLVTAPVYYVLSMILAHEVLDVAYRHEEVTYAVVGFTGAAGFGLGWWGIWRGEVTWNPKRVGRTWGVFVLSFLPGALIGAAIVPLTYSKDTTPILILAPIVWLIFWLFGTALVWKESADERAARLAALGMNGLPCPNCGYNLTGMRECKCPECGAAYTLDQLFAAVDEQRRPLDAAGA